MADWPRPPIPATPTVTVDEFSKAAYAAELELATDVEKRRRDREKEDDDHLWQRFESDDKIEGALLQNFHESVRALAASNAERVQSVAETVQKAAAALTAIYTALLGLMYSVGKVGVPPRAVLPALFLGGAVILSTAYVAYIHKTEDMELAGAKGPPRAKAIIQTTNFIKWSRRQYLTRASYARGAVISLAFGLLLLPAPLLSTHQDSLVVTTPATPTWPPATASGDAGLALYQAQLTEVATLRATQTTPLPPPLNPMIEIGIWLVALAGILLVAAITWLPKFKDKLE